MLKMMTFFHAIHRSITITTKKLKYKEVALDQVAVFSCVDQGAVFWRCFHVWIKWRSFPDQTVFVCSCSTQQSEEDCTCSPDTQTSTKTTAGTKRLWRSTRETSTISADGKKSSALECLKETMEYTATCDVVKSQQICLSP